MKKIWGVLAGTVIFWLVLVTGYVCRDYLGDWFIRAHTGTLFQQIGMVSGGMIRLVLTLTSVGLTLAVCLFLLLLFAALAVELWYQFTKRQIVRILLRRYWGQPEPPEEQPAAPKEPVMARKHSRRTTLSPERLQELVTKAKLGEPDYTDEIKVTYEP